MDLIGHSNNNTTELQGATNMTQVVNNALLNCRFIFIMGGPGCGEKTVCQMFEKRGFTTVSMKDVLKAEVEENPENAVMINGAMNANDLVSLNTVLNLLRRHLLHLSSSTTLFCIHGFPKDIDQVNKFEKEIGTTEIALFLKVCDQTMKIRYKKARDDRNTEVNEATLEKKVRLFREKQLKCLDYYTKMKKLCQIDAEVPVKLVCQNALKCLNKRGN